MALAARAPAQGEGDTLRVAPPFDASSRARLERRHVDLFRIQDGFRLVPQLRGQALDKQGRAILGQRVAGGRRRGADAPQGPEVVRLQGVARGRRERAADPRFPRRGWRFTSRDRRLDGEPDGLHGHEAAAVVPGDAERRELLFQGRALVNLRRAVVWGQVEHRLHE